MQSLPVCGDVGQDAAMDGSVSESSIYTMFPSVVRSRISVLTSLRSTARTIVSHGSGVGRRRYPFGYAGTTKEKESCSSVSTTDSSRATTPTLERDVGDDGKSSQDLSVVVLPQQETRSGVDWDIAMTGVRLWVSAKTQAEQGGDPVALRSMHIDAIRYMHMALPSELTPLEMQSLRASMSPQLVVQTQDTQASDARPEPNMLRQSVARTVCLLVAGLLFMLPVITTFLNRCFEFERQHHLTERLISGGLDFTSTLGERGIELRHLLVRFRNGWVGIACIDIGAWLIDGVIGGLQDGMDAVAQNRDKLS